MDFPSTIGLLARASAPGLWTIDVLQGACLWAPSAAASRTLHPSSCPPVYMCISVYAMVSEELGSTLLETLSRGSPGEEYGRVGSSVL